MLTTIEKIVFVLLSLGTPALRLRENTTVHPQARPGIRRDSAVVGTFILIHVGSRFLGSSFHLAETGNDLWQPFASLVSGLWFDLGLPTIILMQHVFFWG